MNCEIDLETISLEELFKEYGDLKRRYLQMCKASTIDAQQIHELKRSLETAQAAEAFLSQELEQLTNVSVNQQCSDSTKASIELEELRKEHHKLNLDFAALQQDCAVLMEENVELHKQIESMKISRETLASTPSEEMVETEKRLESLEIKNIELLAKLEEYHQESLRFTMNIAERDRNLMILKDQVTCLQENLRAKREELEEHTQLLESTQEQLTEANAKIAMLEAAPGSNDRKGNSLFAEVDDQRQAMKQLLAAQKKSYMQMKTIYQASESEIRRLKNENLAIHNELRACSTIFCNAERVYHKKLNEQIRYLTNKVERLETQLKSTQDILKQVAESKNVLCVDTLLNFCKFETDDLKKQLHSALLQKVDLEHQLRSVTQDMARWRFESLKSRCLLMDREHLLKEHNIRFRPNNAMEFEITEQDIQKARPKIANGDTIPLVSANLPVDSQDILERCEDRESDVSSHAVNDVEQRATKEDHNTIHLYADSSPADNLNSQDNKENSKEAHSCTESKRHVDRTPLVNIQSSENEHAQVSVIGPSILSKGRGGFLLASETSEKSVHFSAKEPQVYNLSPNHSLTESAGHGIANTKKATIVKEFRTKSNVLVRHIVINSDRRYPSPLDEKSATEQENERELRD